MAATYLQDPARAQRRRMVLIVAIILHIFFIWGFASGLATSLVKYVAEPLDTKILQEDKVKDEPPPPPPPPLERPPVQVVAPEITINLTPDAPPPPITQTTTQPVITAPRPPPPAAPGTPLKAVSIPAPEDYYPGAAKQAGQEGVVKVTVCITAQSKIDKVEVGESSGFPLLDDAGVRVARGGRFKAATENGQPTYGCAKLPIRFSLKKS